MTGFSLKFLLETLLIFLEIFAVTFCCIKLVEFEKKVYQFNDKLNETGEKIITTCQNIRNTLKKVNKVIKILTNKRLHQIKRIFMMTLDIIQTIILLRSLNLSKGLKSINYRTLKKLFFAQISKEIIRKILTFGATCA